MKSILLITALVTLASSTPSLNVQWMSFKKQHGKSYENTAEEERRQSIFMDNLRMIEEHNAKYEAGHVSYYLKMNHMGDMLPEEFNSTQFGLKQIETKEEGGKNKLLFDFQSNDVLPDSVNWKELGAVTPIKNQGQCGACWAFSTTGSVEGQVFRKTGKLVPLSEQQLMDCSADYSNFRCGGGLMERAFRYLQDVGGLESEDSYPYEARDGYCKFKPWNAVSGAVVKSYVNLEKGNLSALKQAVARIGPVSIAVSAGSNHFKFYGGGIFNGDDCISFILNHGVLMVGYGAENGKDYWLIKNSWGLTWGEEGYMRLERNDVNLCGIASMASYPIL